jgi:ABC-type sugar transport system ATPase subunit
MLAGIYRPASGVLRFDGRIVNDLPPRQRNIGMVFQSYALYPPLTVYENLAFPLRVQRQSRAVLLSVACGPHLLKILVPAPCVLAPDTPVWLDLSQGPHHFFIPHTGRTLVQR